MATRYLLPCPKCQQPLGVALAQAGEAIQCACGAEVVVPTLRELKRLPSEGIRGAGRGRRWSAERGVVFLAGALCCLAAAIITWQVWPQRAAVNTTKPQFSELTVDLASIQPTDAWEAWTQFRDVTLDYRTTPEFLKNRDKFTRFTYYLYGAASLAALGAGLVLGSVVWPSRPTAGRVDAL